MGTVIARRDVEVESDGENVPGSVQICAPEHHPADENGSDYWGCDVLIDFGDYTSSQNIKGVDAFQALQIAMKMVPVLIKASDPFLNKKLMLWGNPLNDVDEHFGIKPLGEA
jgi:uncharacterized protein DUF6968